MNKTRLYVFKISKETLPMNKGKETINVWYNIFDETGRLLHERQFLDFCETLREAEESIDKFEQKFFDYQGVRGIIYSPEVTQTETPRVIKSEA